VNYFAPLFLSVFIHFGLVLSFSNFFTIDFDKFNIEAKKPITAYIVFAENKKTKPIRAIIGINLISRTYSKKDARGSNIQ